MNTVFACGAELLSPVCVCKTLNGDSNCLGVRLTIDNVTLPAPPPTSRTPSGSSARKLSPGTRAPATKQHAQQYTHQETHIVSYTMPQHTLHTDNPTE